MDAEILLRIRSGWKAFITIRDIIKAKLYQTLRKNLFNSTVVPAMFNVNETLSTKKKEHCLYTIQRTVERPMKTILIHERREFGSRGEWSGGFDHQAAISEVLLGWTCCKVH